MLETKLHKESLKIRQTIERKRLANTSCDFAKYLVRVGDDAVYETKIEFKLLVESLEELGLLFPPLDMLGKVEESYAEDEPEDATHECRPNLLPQCHIAFLPSNHTTLATIRFNATPPSAGVSTAKGRLGNY